MLSKEETEKLKEYFRWVHEELSTYGSENHINLETLDNKLYLLEQHIEKLETNYEILIHDISLIAESVGLEEDATIEEIAQAVSDSYYKRLYTKTK